MSYRKDQNLDPIEYFSGQAAVSKGGQSPWRTTACLIHGGSDSLRFRADTGRWVCMACGAKGGSVIDHYMQLRSCSFPEAAKALGVWSERGGPARYGPSSKRAALPARDAIEALYVESHLVAVAALNLANGVTLTSADKERLMKAAGRIQLIAEDYK